MSSVLLDLIINLQASDLRDICQRNSLITSGNSKQELFDCISFVLNHCAISDDQPQLSRKTLIDSILEKNLSNGSIDAHYVQEIKEQPNYWLYSNRMRFGYITYVNGNISYNNDGEDEAFVEYGENIVSAVVDDDNSEIYSSNLTTAIDMLRIHNNS